MAESAVSTRETRAVLTATAVTALAKAVGESPATTAWRQRARELYTRSAWPDHTEQRWRYTDAAALMPAQAGSVPADAGGAAAAEAAVTWQRIGADEPAVLVTPYAAPQLNAAAAAAGVAVTPLGHHADDTALLGSVVSPEAGLFAAFNGAAWNAGAAVRIPAGRTLERPLRLVVPAGDGALPRLLVAVGPRARATLIEDHCGGSADSRVVAVSELIVGAGARLDHVLLQRWNDAVHGHLILRGRVERDAVLSSVTAAFGGRLSKLDLGGILAGPGARSGLRGVLLGERRQQFDHHTRHHHLSGDTRSDIDFKVALGDRARSIYTGLIRIDPGAPRSEAYQENRNLLLSDRCRADSIPELEILTDEVSCSHGATVAPIDPQQQFYLASRGVDPVAAIQLIVGGFVAAVTDRLPPAVAAEIADLIAARLARVAGGA